ncbi:pentatricopeptide repeat domain-containing protein [Colletotrichum costaricense]|uniref:Pentatricopeptide repeat domain-containing protein n=1 Tax=Colletotrichum costaricense TaxID=1209916 RepID=A0AAI9YT27_9PEZI|nr:pentatricopeptide repeat domain-containing protein [Colletotrichum costaricense]KAK1522076.1 pentatricopeptide repeat domain-containing protein [Colletotrichum costaricense]
MPTIYSSLYQNFIRQGFAKSFTHGYAQSVVAATHPILNTQNRPSFARRNTNRFGRLQSLQLQSAFHTAERTSAGLPQHHHEKLDEKLKHGSLDAYFEALQEQQASEEDIDKEWTQFQFQRQIEWKPSPASILVGESKAHDAEELAATQDGEASPIPLEAQAALAQIDAALEKEIEFRSRMEALEEASEHSIRSASHNGSAARSYQSPAIDRSRTPVSVARTATPPFDPQSQVYADHLHKLSEDGRYAEIPAVFEAMLVAGVQPIASAYNALLVAAIHLPTAKNEMVTKALDVYADMLRRKIVPDSDTYNILVGLLAARSLEVASLKKTLHDKLVRFGGMDEPGKFMFASHELEHAILSEDDRLDLAMDMFEKSVLTQRASYSAESYHQLISACAQAGRVTDMLRLYEHMELNRVTPFAAMFPSMITAFATSGDLVSAVECYNEYKDLAVANDNGEPTLNDRLDAEVYASVIHAYIISDKVDGAMKFYEKIITEYGVRAGDIKDAIVSSGMVKAFTDRGIFNEALRWAQVVEAEVRADPMSSLATRAADHGDKHTAVAAFANLPINFHQIATPAMALLALSVRQGDVASAARYWHVLCAPETPVTPALIEPTAMYAIAMIGSGQVAEGLAESELMFQRIRAANPESADEIEEGVDFVHQFMSSRGITDPRELSSQNLSASPFTTSATVSSFEDSFDPYAHNTDFKGSSLISDELEGSHGRKGPRLHDALGRFRNMRRAGRHPRYITYAKLISAASREGKMELCNDILAMARTDVPLLPQYAVVRYGWSSILDAMVGACLTIGHRQIAEQYHQELLAMGAAPSANTFGLYITTLKESAKTFDEASEAVKIFHRAKAEGVEPSSFLYNALIGKLGKARRIDDCLFYFAEMRALGIKPTSVTYGTIVNALCRVSDEKFAEELFDEMEAMPNYKARPAPYNSMMQFFLTTKRDKAKVLAYYDRMMAKGIAPTAHTYKLLVDTHATLEPVDMAAAEKVLEAIRTSGQKPEAVHFAALIHARGCNLHDMEGARKVFDSVMADRAVTANASLFQALFEAMVANHKVVDTEAILGQMRRRGVEMTPYIANTLIHGWAAEKQIEKAQAIYDSVGHEKREPSTYEAMTRAYLAVEEREKAKGVVGEMLCRGYPSAVVNKVLELLGGGGGEEAVAHN